MKTNLLNSQKLERRNPLIQERNKGNAQFQFTIMAEMYTGCKRSDFFMGKVRRSGGIRNSSNKI